MVDISATNSRFHRLAMPEVKTDPGASPSHVRSSDEPEVKDSRRISGPPIRGRGLPSPLPMDVIKKLVMDGKTVDIHVLIESLRSWGVNVGLQEPNVAKPHGGGTFVNTETHGDTVYVNKFVLGAALQTKDPKAQANAILNIMVGAQEVLKRGEVGVFRDVWNKVFHTGDNVEAACDFLTNEQIGYLKTVLEQRPGYFKFLDVALAKRQAQ